MYNDDKIELTGKNGTTFFMNGYDNPDYISVYGAGYIITQNGLIVAVKDGEDHDQVFSEYLKKFLEIKTPYYRQSTEAAKILTELNNIVYYGIKVKDIRNMKNGDNSGYSVICLPKFENITLEQKQVISKLLSTNISRISGNRLLEVNFGNIVTGKSYREEDVIEILGLDEIKSKLTKRN